MGWPGLAGLLGLLTAVIAAATGWIVLPHDNERLARRQQGLSNAVVTARENAALPADAQTAQKWAAGLPDAADALRFVEFVQSEAQQRALQIEATEYRSESTVGGKVRRYRVVMPVRGSYPALRGWIDEVMFRFPTVALDEFSLRRDGEGASGVVGRAQLSHYSRTAGP
jgi:hypothetical protein